MDLIFFFVLFSFLIWIRSTGIKQRKYLCIPVAESWLIHLLLGRKEGPDEEGACQKSGSYENIECLWFFVDKVATNKN